MNANSSDGEPRTGVESGNGKKRFWKRPLTWVVTVLLGALAAVLGGALQDLFKTAGSKVVNEFGKERAPFTVAFQDDSCPAVWTHFPDELQKAVIGKPENEGRTILVKNREADGGVTDLTVTLQGRTQSAVVITGARAVMSGPSQSPPASVFGTGGCGAAVPTRSFAIDLDSKSPTATALNPDEFSGPSPAIVNFPYKISATDPEVFHFSVRTAGCDCTWYLEIEWNSNGKVGAYQLDNGGKPFRTLALKSDTWQPVGLYVGKDGRVTGLSRTSY
ncbi:hypothetical protein SLAV_01325 [Streptomyces lavendulae subsp. lavendulae]|uniref:Uncharacterized protein n=1 Tax=Streptomyces lavendulae subsp. lavendulae TaxID=58340 RepID=A0A2K8P620_STRLA|nr:hypothetical protein [Streptomyces lavendulae]ATZ22194.1 hypothetical protein SLAV_01325 [Streptomyces lavendulae subsp. lavendulae]